MKVSDIMTKNVIGISPEESAAVAARTLAHYNIGMLPVCQNGKLYGVVTDRDLITRCVASGRQPDQTLVKELMTGQVLSVSPQMDTESAARLMGSRQIRRLPVVEEGRLCGMVSLGDIARRGADRELAAQALEGIVSNVKKG